MSSFLLYQDHHPHQRVQQLVRRKYSVGAHAGAESASTETRTETEIELPPVSITTLPTLPERSAYSRVDQPPEEVLPPSKFLFVIEHFKKPHDNLIGIATI